MLIKTKKKNQQEEQEDKERDARVTPCAEAAVQEMQRAEGQVDQTGDEHETPDARQEQDKAHAQARARQTQVPTGETGGTQGEEQEMQAEKIPAAQTVTGGQLVTEGHQPTVRQGEAVVVMSQLPTPTCRPEMPAFVLRAQAQGTERAGGSLQQERGRRGRRK